MVEKMAHKRKKKSSEVEIKSEAKKKERFPVK